MTELKKGLQAKILEFESYKTNPNHQSEMEQNAVLVTLKTLKYLDSLAEFEHLHKPVVGGPGSASALDGEQLGNKARDTVAEREEIKKAFDWLTEKGLNETHLSHPINLYGWDCESVLILNPHCVTECGGVLNLNVINNIKLKFFVRINDKTGSFTYEPIPINEEWLLKFGFTKENPDYFVKHICDYKYCFRFADFRNNWGFYIEYTDSPFLSDEGKKYFVSCGNSEVIGTGTCYIHQLQNLWFSLTGTELVVSSGGDSPNLY